jgi:hypothetical protein
LGTRVAERGGVVDLVDDKRECSVNDFLSHPRRCGGVVKPPARCEGHCDRQQEQRNKPSHATKEHAAKSI